MIFVTVGSSQWPFDRLLRALDGLELEEKLVAQCGPSAVRPAGADCVPFLPYDEIVDHMRRARIVVSHAGVGSFLLATQLGKRPLLVPRMRQFGEAVDDHQLDLGSRLSEAGLARLVRDPSDLAHVIAQPDDAAASAPAEYPPPELVAEVHQYIAAAVRGT